MTASLADRILASDLARTASTPCCRRVVACCPSYRVHVQCCGITYTVKRGAFAAELVERVRA